MYGAEREIHVTVVCFKNPIGNYIPQRLFFSGSTGLLEGAPIGSLGLPQ